MGKARKYGESPGEVWSERPPNGAAHREMTAQKRNPDGTAHGSGLKMGWDNSERGKCRRNDSSKVPGISFGGEKGSTSPGFNVTAAQRYREGVKHGGDCFNDPTWAGKQGGSKQPGISGPRNNGKGDKWFQDGAARHGSKSDSRKAASAEIAKIPFPLAQYIARCFKTHAEVCA
jgi:hypothetical protein